MKSDNDSDALRIEKSFWTHELSSHLGIGKSTLNKWSRELEKQGYIFLKDDSDKRAFTEHDAIALRKMKEYLSNKMSLIDAAKAVTASYKRKIDSEVEGERAIVAIDEKKQETRSDIRYLKELSELKEAVTEQGAVIHDLVQLNQELIKRLDEQEIRNRERDEIRDRNLVNLAREIQETRQLQIAAAEESENSKKKWWKFWG